MNVRGIYKAGIIRAGVGIQISGIGYTRTRPDIRRILDTQYPILWDWVLKCKINRVLDNLNGYWVLPEYPIYYFKHISN